MNWLGLAGGITTILLVVVSLFVPWWKLTVGDSILTANVSPVYTNFEFTGNSFSVPLILALNLTSIILLASGGIVMLIYSIIPTRQYSKQLLGFGYRKPLYFVILFIIGLLAMMLIAQSVFNLSVPVVGSLETTLPSSMTQGMNVRVLLTAGFLWPFWLAILSAGLCIAARVFHKRISSPTNPPVPVSETADSTKSAPVS